MKATDGNLKLTQSYTIIGHDYHGKFADTLSAENCENCGNVISNIAIVEGSNDKRHYRIGLDCAATLTGIEPDAIAQAKKELRQKAKFYKFLKTEMTFFVIEENEYQFYDTPIEKVNGRKPRFAYRCGLSYGANLPLDAGKQKKFVVTSQEWVEYSVIDDGGFFKREYIIADIE